LSSFAERLSRARSVGFAEVDGMPASRVPGHAGRFVVGDVGDVRVLVQQGRVHLYEGWSGADVVLGVRALARLGVKAIVLTNAAGGLRRDWMPGTLMSIRDHINFQGASALDRNESGSGSPYDTELGLAVERASHAAGVKVESGVYAGVLGPSYETPAEIRMLAWMGADAVGMSTVLEAVAAHAAGMRVAAISCITNFAAGMSAAPLSHADVLRAGRESSERFCALLESTVVEIARSIG
jgi:purine-nucleoside phosphorylase